MQGESMQNWFELQIKFAMKGDWFLLEISYPARKEPSTGAENVTVLLILNILTESRRRGRGPGIHLPSDGDLRWNKLSIFASWHRVPPRVTWVRGGGGWGPLVLATVALQGRIIALLEYQVTGPDAAETGSWHIRDKTRYKGQQAWHVLWLASRMFTSGFLPKRRRNWRDTCYNWNATFILTMFHGHFPRPIAKWKIAHL